MSGIDIGAVAEKYFSTLVVAPAGCDVQWCAIVTVAGVGISMMRQEHLNTLPPVCSHTYIYIHTIIHMCIDTYTKSYTCMYAHAHAQTHPHTHTHTHSHTRMHAHTSQGYGAEEKVCEKRMVRVLGRI